MREERFSLTIGYVIGLINGILLGLMLAGYIIF